MATMRVEQGSWESTACILCTLNCGLEVQTEGGRITRIRGDKGHPVSKGYQCQKALRLDYYQNGDHRLRTPLKKRADGSFEEISWDRAVGDVAEKLKAIRDTHGGHAIAFYGGGGQGNHLGGAYSGSLRAAMGTRYIYTSLAQEKTGGFWIDGKLFGRQNCHPSEDVHNAEYLILIGTNSWQSHGFPQARKVLQEFARDAKKTLVVIDPRRTETVEKADVHLQVRPGGDAHLLLAMLGTIVQEGLEDEAFIEERTTDFDTLRDVLMAIPVDEYAREAGVEPELLRTVARDYAQAESACIRTDLGIEHTVHSTLNLYLAKLLYLITGHFGRKGTNAFHTSFLPLIGHSREPEEGGLTTKVTGMKEIGKLFPPNILPQEISTDHPDRIRAVVVESSNPLLTAADTRAFEKAFKNLELLVVIDVAMTETARLADYVLPASSQFEKWEATFFNFEFPKNYFHLRRPLFEPTGDTLAEPEIYRRLVAAMGEIPERFPVLEWVAKIDRMAPRLRLFPAALAVTFKLRPKLQAYAPLVLYATLGKALPNGAASAAILWVASRMFSKKNGAAVEGAGIRDEGAGLAEALFKRVLESEAGSIVSVHDYEDTWSFLRHKDGKIHLAIGEMFEEIRELEGEGRDEAFPLILSAGERRDYNANTIFRDGAWRKKDPNGMLKVHPNDAKEIGVEDGDAVYCETKGGSLEVEVTVTDEIREGVVSLPHGYGMQEEQGEGGGLSRQGPAINFLTSSDHCDAIAKTPFHKYIPVRLRRVAGEAVLAESVGEERTGNR